MAAIEAEFDDFYQCAICFNYMFDRRPRRLSCRHTFCESCLDQLKQNYFPIKFRIDCPKCRGNTFFDSLTELTMNVAITEMKEREDYIFSTKNKYCGACTKSANLVKALSFCKDCNRNMCSKCLETHSLVPLFKSHVIFNLEETKLTQNNICREHMKTLCLVCNKCVKLICDDCIFDEHHRDHSFAIEEPVAGFASVEKAKRNFLEEVQELCKYLENVNSSICQARETLSSSKLPPSGMERAALFDQIKSICAQRSADFSEECKITLEMLGKVIENMQNSRANELKGELITCEKAVEQVRFHDAQFDKVEEKLEEIEGYLKGTKSK